MQIQNDHIDEAHLAQLGSDAVTLLRSGDVSALATQFGYAVAFSREVPVAIQEDLAACLAELGATSLAPDRLPSTSVRYFGHNDSGLVAVVECLASTNNGAEVLVELVVTSKGAGTYVCLEQLSAAA
jgi:hypothetical protein